MIDAPPPQLGLADAAQRLLGAHMHTTRHAYLHFPMVDLAEKSPLDWIKGLNTLGQTSASGRSRRRFRRSRSR